jgi:FKBP-type peptidyl-prolyl cis-trans isomerase
MLIRKIFYLLFAATLILQCSNRGNSGQNLTQKDLKEPLIEENIKITQEEGRMIDRFVERRQWDMKQTGTGLRYMIYENGPGIKAEAGMVATVEYEISLLDGTLCYTSVEKGPRKFLIGRDNVESGIHEAVTLMNVGDKGKFIVPSYLAHGLSGDQNKIPPRSSLVVDLHLIRLD